jgi:crossover junction endodeoxyribonuclease RuvC
LRICGIDPGTRVVGVAVIEDEPVRKLVAARAVRLDPKRALALRLRDLEAELFAFLALHAPRQVAVESIFHGPNVRSLIGLGEGRGVALLAAAKQGAEIYEYSPSEVKKAATGSGAATKDAVKRWVVVEFPELSQAGKDVTDAVAIAFCHAQRRRLIEQVREGVPPLALLRATRGGSRRGRRR